MNLPPSHPRAVAWLPVLACALLLISAMLVALPGLMGMGRVHSATYNEGWNVYHAARVAAGAWE